MLACALRDHGNGGEHILDAMVELGDQQALLHLHSLALRYVNIDADYACRVSGTVVRNQGTRFYPLHRAIWRNDTIFRVLRTASFSKCLAVKSVKPSEVVRMHTGSPFLDEGLSGSLGHAVNDRVAR